MTDFQELAAKELDRWATHNPERGMQKASVLAYMARTEALKPEPVKRFDTIYVISMRNNHTENEWKVLESYAYQNAAYQRLVTFTTHPDYSKLETEYKLEPVSFKS